MNLNDRKEISSLMWGGGLEGLGVKSSGYLWKARLALTGKGHKEHS